MRNLILFITRMTIIVSLLTVTFVINSYSQTSRKVPHTCDIYEENDLPRIKIKVNIHFILDENGHNNYTAIDNDLGNTSRNGVDIANEILQTMNDGFSQLQPMISKKPDNTDHPTISDLGVDYVLYTNQSVCEIQDNYGGVWFWNYEHYDITEPINDGDPDFAPEHLKSLFSQYDNIFDIFVIGSRFYYDGGVENYSIGGESPSPNGSGSSMRVHNLWYWSEFRGQSGIKIGPTINHEMGHVVAALSHTSHTYIDGNNITHFNAAVATDSDINRDQETIESNNLMTYNGCSCAISLEQFKKIRNALLNGNKPYVDQSELCDLNSTPIVIPANTYVIWDSYRELRQNVVIEPTGTLEITCDLETNGKFLVKRGGKLLVLNATISNLCPNEYWRGIEVWGNPAVSHPVGDNLYNYPLDENDPGLVYLNNAALVKPVDGVFTWNDDNYLMPQYWGGIVQARSSDFIGHRRGVAFMQYNRSDNSSYFNDCYFASTTGYAGVTMWNVLKVNFIDCEFASQNSINNYAKKGIVAIDANPQINHCVFNGNRYGLEAHSTFSFVGEKLKVFNTTQFEGDINTSAHIYSNGFLGLEVEKSIFTDGLFQIFLNGVTSFDINANVLSGARSAGLSMHNTRSEVKKLMQNYFSSNVFGVQTFLENLNFQFIANCFNHPNHDIKIAPFRQFDHQGNAAVSNNNYFHAYMNNARAELYSQFSRFTYFTPDNNTNPRTIPHCEQTSICSSGVNSLHRNDHAEIGLVYPLHCTQMAIPDSSDLTDFISEDTSFIYLTQKLDSLLLLISEQEEIISNMGQNDPDSVLIHSQLLSNQYYRKYYQMKIMQSLFAYRQYDSLRAFMHNENVDNKLILIAGLEVNKRNYRAADSLLATLQGLSDDHQKYYDIEHIHLKFLQNPVDSFPTTQDSLFLEDMAIDTTWASGYARTLLILYYNRYLDTAAYTIDTLEQYNRGQNIEEYLHDEIVCNNPVVDEINIIFTNFVNDRLQIELFDLNGKIAYTRTVKIADNNLKLNVNMLNKGLYILRIENSLYKYPAKLILKL